MTPQQQDAWATRAILNTAVNRIQLVGSKTLQSTDSPTVIFQPINIGLIKRFIVSVTATANFNATGTANTVVTDFGVANFFGQNSIQYSDLNNYLRINTSGAHLSLVANAKRRGNYGGATASTTSGVQTPNLPPGTVPRPTMLSAVSPTWPVFTWSNPSAGTPAVQLRGVFEIPLAYSDTDLRGAVWANVLNAVQTLTLTVNTSPDVISTPAAPQDSTFAVFVAGSLNPLLTYSNITITVYQEYLDQLPQANGVAILPALSLATAYELKSTVFDAITQGQEFYIPYANQRSFLSTFVTYFNASTPVGAGGASPTTPPYGRVTGQDIQYWALVAANSTYVWRVDPLTNQLFTRNVTSTDLPYGTYMFDTRQKNIATLQYGNLALVLNPLIAGPGAYANVMWEDFALLNTLQSGPSLSS
jgi:hypothetical protein